MRSVLSAYAGLARHSHDGAIAAALHRGAHVTDAHRQLSALVRELITDAAGAGQVRTDVPATELAGFCLNALAAAGGLSSEAAVRRLVTVTVSALRPPS